MQSWSYGFEYFEEKDQSVSHLKNEEGVCRISPATAGLLKSSIISGIFVGCIFVKFSES